MSIDAKYGIQIHEGMIARHRPAFKFGYNAEVGTDEETIWSQGGIYSHLTSASILKVSSSNDADVSTIKLEGLDANYDEISEDVTLTGQTAVNTNNSFLRVNRMYVTADVNGEPAGDIYAGTGTVTSGVPANKYSKINASDNQTLQTVYTVPRNHTAYIFHLTVSSGTSSTNKFATCRLMMREQGGVFRTQTYTTIHNNFVEYTFGVPLAFPAKSDIETRAFASSGTDAISSTFSYVLVKDEAS